MDIKTTLEKYKALSDYFAPDYERDNEILTEFKKNNPKLSKQQTVELVDLLKNNTEIVDKYFVADLLYLYDNFEKELLEPMLKTAINLKDPSINRIFLRPCLATFGVKTVADNLADKFGKADIIERIGILNLVYWIRSQENGEANKLHKTILEKANNVSNLIELYHYKLRYAEKIKRRNKIPDNASDLIKAINGNKEYEDLLFDKLGWTRTTPANKTNTKMSDNAEIKQHNQQRNLTIFFTFLLTIMCLRQAHLIFKLINHTIEYLEGMELVYSMFLIQLPALIHLLSALVWRINYKKAMGKFIWIEATLFLGSVGLYFVLHYVSYC